MLDHVSVAVRKLRASADAYRQVLGCVGLQRLVVRPATIGFGTRYPEFRRNARLSQTALPADTGIHVCLHAPDEASVRAFHTAAITAGWLDAGAPGPRKAEMTPYYAAFVQDPGGNNLEAATFPRKA